jgi:hypothetical protein
VSKSDFWYVWTCSRIEWAMAVLYIHKWVELSPFLSLYTHLNSPPNPNSIAIVDANCSGEFSWQVMSHSNWSTKILFPTMISS